MTYSSKTIYFYGSLTMLFKTLVCTIKKKYKCKPAKMRTLQFDMSVRSCNLILKS